MAPDGPGLGEERAVRRFFSLPLGLAGNQQINLQMLSKEGCLVET